MTVTVEPVDLLPPDWRSWAPDVKRRFLDKLLERAAGSRGERWEPYPWQRPHRHPEGWPFGRVCTAECAAFPDLVLRAQEMWILWGGRGIGKTDGGAHEMLEHVNGPACDRRAPGGHRIGIVAPTLGDAVESCVTGLSGLQAYDPRVKVVTTTGGTIVRFPNGVRGKVFGAHTENDVERLRAGGNRCMVWLEEAAAMRYLGAVLAQVRPGLRVGSHAHMIVTTTPRTRPEVREMLAAEGVHITKGRTRDATHLEAETREALERIYAGTSTGRQELDGDLLADVEGALWSRDLIDRNRWAPGSQPDMRRVVVAIDPNAGGPDEAGIIVMGVGRDKLPDRADRLSEHGYVLADESASFTSSAGWARAAVQAYHRWQADAIVAETNNGGDMVGLTVQTVDPTVRYRSVTATRGKARRAEPIVQLYEQNRIHHVGAFPKAEDQMTTWTEDAGWSPDRMDALVWAATDLLVTRRGGFAGTA